MKDSCVVGCVCGCGQQGCGCHETDSNVKTAAPEFIDGTKTGKCRLCGRGTRSFRQVRSMEGLLVDVIFCMSCDLTDEARRRIIDAGHG